LKLTQPFVWNIIATKTACITGKKEKPILCIETGKTEELTSFPWGGTKNAEGAGFGN